MSEKVKRSEMPSFSEIQEPLKRDEIGILKAASDQYDEIHNDELTGLRRQKGFMREVSEILKSGEEKPKYLAIIFLDIDKFKAINDNQGYEQGNEAIKQVAHKLKELFRRDEDILAAPISRWGGDEFEICVPFYEPIDGENRRPIISHVELEKFVKEGLEGLLLKDESLPNYIRNLKVSVGAAAYNVEQFNGDVERVLEVAQERMKAMKEESYYNSQTHHI